jgi:hypothetical protein
MPLGATDTQTLLSSSIPGKASWMAIPLRLGIPTNDIAHLPDREASRLGVEADAWS